MTSKYNLPDGTTVYKFCSEHFLPYKNVRFSIKRYSILWSDKSLEFIIKYVLLRYLRRKSDKDIINFINNIENSNNWNLLLISKTLNIEYLAMYKLLKYGFSKREAFYIVWFAYDKISSTGKFTITKKQISKFINFKNSLNWRNDEDLRFILVLLKFNDENVINYFLKQREKNLSKIIKKNVYSWNYLKNHYEDILNVINFKEYQLYKKICLNNIPQIIKYLNTVARYVVINYVRNDQDKTCLHLEDEVYENKDRYNFIY